jgi:site-specific DNA recombinase
VTRKAAILARVSTPSQLRGGYGIPVQLEAGRAYAESAGFSVTGEFVDQVSGASETREAFFRLLSEAELYEVVIIYDLTRLGRSEELSHRFLRLMQEAGLEVHSVKRGLISADIQTGIEVALSAEERRKTVERTQLGLIAEARAGKLPNGLSLFGFHNIPGQNRAIIDPAAAPTVRRVFALAGQGLSYRAIARDMMQEGLKTPLGSSQWFQHTVRRIVCNPAYKGEFVWIHKTAGRFVIPVPPIVSPEVWQAAQRSKRGPPVRVPLPLSGRLRCGRCGHAMSVRKVMRDGEPVYFYYRCGSISRPSGACGAGLARRDKIESQAEAELRRVLSSPELLREMLASDKDRSEHDQRRLDGLSERAERVTEMRLDGLISRDKAREMMAEIDAERQALLKDATPDLPLQKYAGAAQMMPFTELAAFTGAIFTVLDGVVTVELSGA